MSVPEDHRVDWIGVDWGTTHMRLYAFDADDRVVASCDDGPGMNAIAPHEFATALAGLVGRVCADDPIPPVLMCGMVGSRQGWAEATYLNLPVHLDDIAAKAVAVPTDAPFSEVRILPGIAKRDPNAPDVVRGEETQALGYAATHTSGDATLCMPGTHSKWLRLSGDTVTGIRTFMTGELFALLAERSILRHSVAAEAFDMDAFIGGVHAGAEATSAVLSHLFALRAGHLLFDQHAERQRARLSGLLIGAELAAALPQAHSETIAVIGGAPLTQLYGDALSALGRRAHIHDGNAMVAAGLAHAYRRSKVLARRAS